MFGTFLGMLGAFLFGSLAIIYKSEALFLIATCAFGMAMGIGFHLRFAALAVVSAAHHKSFAMTLVVSGGCLAAFAGPESAQGSIHMVSSYPYLGVMIMTGVFHVLNACFLFMVQFPDSAGSTVSTIKEVEKHDASDIEKEPMDPNVELVHNDASPSLRELFSSRAFMLPLLMSSSSWAAMGLPMGLVRIVMASVGYTSRQSLLVMELHFVGMYAPGFVTGRWIQAYGYKNMCFVGCAVFVVALILLQVVRVVDHLVLWALGMILIGVGWNFVFTSSTVWLTQGALQTRFALATMQSLNDFGMFLLSGIWILSASFIYSAGGAELAGWGVLLWVVAGILTFMIFLLALDFVVPRRSTEAPI
jgi:hypothetical protein